MTTIQPPTPAAPAAPTPLQHAAPVAPVPAVAPAAPTPIAAAPVAPVAPAQPAAAPAPVAPVPMYDQFTGQPVAPAVMFDQFTGQPIAAAPVAPAAAPVAPAAAPAATSYEIAQQAQQAETARQAADDAYKAELTFEHNFNSVIDANKSSFKMTPAELRKPLADFKGEQLNRELKISACQDFFSSDDNVKVLHQQDQDYVAAELKKHGDNRNTTQLWAVLENALHIKARLQQNSDFRRADGGNGNTNTPNIDTYLKRVKLRGEGKRATT